MPKGRDLLGFAAAAIALLASLGSYGLVEPSDARYAEIAREMWVSGDHLFPRLLGIYHFHKPPLVYWLSDLGYTGLGLNEWGARLPLGVLGLMLCWLLWRFARRHLPAGSAPWAAALAATTPAVLGAGRMLTTDLLLCVCLTLTWTSWYDAWSGKGGRGSLLAAYLGAGLAFLAKGPVAWLLLLLVIVPFAILRRGSRPATAPRWGIAWGLILVLAVSLPWYLYVVLRTPGLLSYFLGGQIASRFQEGGMGHSHPWHYYLWVYTALGLPWILLAPKGWRLLRRELSPLALFLALWALVPPLFFSLPSTKLPLYVLPAYPALALLGGTVLDNEPALAGPVLRKAGLLFLVLGGALALLGLGVIPLRGGDLHALSRAELRLLFLPLALAVLAGGACAWGWARERPTAAAAALVTVLAVLPAWAFSRGEALPLRTAKVVGQAAARELGRGDLLVEYRDLSAGLPFYAGTIPILAVIDRETRFEETPVTGRVIDKAAFEELWTGPRRVLVATRARRAAELVPAVLLARGGGYVLLANR